MHPLFHIHGAVRVEYRVRTRALGPHLGAIESESQRIGGSGGVCALALSQLGARVHLSGNALGDDSHGRFLKKQLEAAGISGDFSLQSGLSTPYAILLRDESSETQTLLSAGAQHIELPLLMSGEEGTNPLNFSFHNRDGSYGELLSNLHTALRIWVNLTDSKEKVSVREERIGSWIAKYDASFGEFPLEDGKEKRGSA